MKHTLIKPLRLCLIFLAMQLGANAQQSHCATLLGDQTKAFLMGRSNQLNNIKNQNPNIQTRRSVPIKFHLVADGNGNGYYRTADLYELMCTLNRQFDTTNIRFYMLEPINYIANTNFYNFTNIAFGDACMNQYNVANACNVYINENPWGACGYAYYPNSGPFNGNAGIFLAKSCSDPKSNTTFAHEMGHYLALPHTFDVVSGNIEFVNRANCSTAGDLFCDTPADFINQRWNCPYNGTQTDPNGQPYSPDPRFFMSYSLDACMNRFSAQQRTAMDFSLTNDRPYLLNPSAPNIITLPATTNIIPADSSTNVRQFTFRWRAIPNATGYIFRAKRSNFNTYQVLVYVTDTFYNYVGPVFSNPNFWQQWSVKPVGLNAFCSSYSPSSYFKSDPTPTTIEEIDFRDREIGVAPSLVSLTMPLVNIFFKQNTNSGIELKHLDVYDTTGKLIVSQKNISNNIYGLDVSNLPIGLYFIKVTTPKGTYSSKFVVRD